MEVSTFAVNAENEVSQLETSVERNETRYIESQEVVDSRVFFNVL
jgi:hypothetical protein